MRTITAIIIAALIVGCSQKSDVSSPEDDNLYITLNFPDQLLTTTINSYKITITASDLTASYQESASLTPESGGQAEISAYAPPGDDRLVTIHLFQATGSVIYWANNRLNIPTDSTASFSATVTQSAGGSASQIKIFRDNLPWNSEALDEVLDDIGIVLGSEENQYQIIPSSAFDTVTMIVGEDLIIIANDQSQEFYDNYFAAQTRIDSFVTNGGSIFWEACDLGWARGSISEAGVELPGEVGTVSGYEEYNYLTSSEWELTSGLDSILIGNYASHEGFNNLPADAVVYTVDGHSLPTLVSFSYGVGWAILSGQPLEYSYDRSDSLNCGYILPHIIQFILGVEVDTTISSYEKMGRMMPPAINSAGYNSK